MKKLLLVFGIVVLMSMPVFAQQTFYMVDYFSNNAGPVAGAPDQVIRLVNGGTFGTPLTVPAGDICSNIYVYDNNQEMIACCACRLTPNELATASVGTQLTNNPVTSVVPPAGVIKIFNTPGNIPCDPAASGNTLFFSIQGYATHLQTTGGATYLTETALVGSPISAEEFFFNQQACSFARYLGSGKGTCSCTVPGL